MLRAIRPENLEQVACPVCASTQFRKRFRKQDLDIVRCLGCRAVYVNPRLCLDTLCKLYNGQSISNTQYYLRTLQLDALGFAKRLELIEKHCQGRNLLDIGCGPGTFLKVAAERNWNTIGIEVNASSVASCHAAGLKAICGTFPHAELTGKRFDAIVLNDVIEHLTEPRQALETIREMLAPRGVLFMSTPDVGSMVSRLSGVRWLHLKPIEHLTYFDRRTLRRTLNETGFEIEFLRSMGRPRSLALILDRLKTYSPLLSKLCLTVVNERWAEKVALPINPGDEMAVLARKR